jgi:hypothetical protein
MSYSPYEIKKQGGFPPCKTTEVLKADLLLLHRKSAVDV